MPYHKNTAWYGVAVLIVLFCMSYVDRLILSLLATDIAGHLHVSDTQLGILFGLGFGVVYALAGLPLAHFIDRSRRVPLVATGVACWSICTVASGFASNFTLLLILRAGVAIGEAVLSPAAISYIADAFPREKRSLPTTLYTAVATVMGSGSFIVGGAALQAATYLSETIPMAPWQITLILVGAPGLIMAPLLLFTVQEPERVGDVGSESFDTVGTAFAYASKEWILYGCIMVTAAMTGMATFAKVAWTPTLLVRGFEMKAATAGYLYGTIGLVAGVAGAAVWPAIVKTWTGRGRRDAVILVIAVCLTLSWICLATVGTTRSQSMLLIAAGLANFFGAAIVVLMPWVFQMVTPSRMKARIMAMYLLSSSLVGLTLGPTIAAKLSESFFVGPFAIGLGMASLVLVVGPISSFTIWLVRKPYLHALSLAEAREVSSGELSRALIPAIRSSEKHG